MQDNVVLKDCQWSRFQGETEDIKRIIFCSELEVINGGNRKYTNEIKHGKYKLISIFI